MSHVAQQPPHAARVHSRVLVVHDDLGIRRNPESSKRRLDILYAGQRMPAVGASGWSGEVAREAGLHGAGNVRGAVLLASPGFVTQVIAAIDNDP